VQHRHYHLIRLNTFGILSDYAMEMHDSENICEVTNLDSGKENLAMGSPETPQRRALTFLCSRFHRLLQELKCLLGCWEVIKVIKINCAYFFGF
jgi:hypothetical protein